MRGIQEFVIMLGFLFISTGVHKREEGIYVEVNG